MLDENSVLGEARYQDIVVIDDDVVEDTEIFSITANISPQLSLQVAILDNDGIYM